MASLLYAFKVFHCHNNYRPVIPEVSNSLNRRFTNAVNGENKYSQYECIIQDCCLYFEMYLCRQQAIYFLSWRHCSSGFYGTIDASRCCTCFMIGEGSNAQTHCGTRARRSWEHRCSTTRGTMCHRGEREMEGSTPKLPLPIYPPGGGEGGLIKYLTLE